MRTKWPRRKKKLPGVTGMAPILRANNELLAGFALSKDEEN